jgi:hypothetical protein
MDRNKCIRTGQHTTVGGSKSKDIVEIGDELVTYEDTDCPHCGTPADRKIINRQKI